MKIEVKDIYVTINMIRSNHGVDVMRQWIDRSADFARQPPGVSIKGLLRQRDRRALYQALIHAVAMDDVVVATALLNSSLTFPFLGELVAFAAENRCSRSLALLIDCSAPLNIANPHGYTPIQLAAMGGRVEDVSALLDAGVDPDGVADLGERHQLLMRGEILRLLIDRGARLPDHVIRIALNREARGDIVDD